MTGSLLEICVTFGLAAVGTLLVVDGYQQGRIWWGIPRFTRADNPTGFRIVMYMHVGVTGFMWLVFVASVSATLFGWPR